VRVHQTGSSSRGTSYLPQVFETPLKELSDTHFPQAAKIVLVQDNLSTHKQASLHEAFPAEQARRLAERFAWHWMPKHSNWLDLADRELSRCRASALIGAFLTGRS